MPSHLLNTEPNCTVHRAYVDTHPTYASVVNQETNHNGRRKPAVDKYVEVDECLARGYLLLQNVSLIVQ